MGWCFIVNSNRKKFERSLIDLTASSSTKLVRVNRVSVTHLEVNTALVVFTSRSHRQLCKTIIRSHKNKQNEIILNRKIKSKFVAERNYQSVSPSYNSSFVPEIEKTATTKPFFWQITKNVQFDDLPQQCSDFLNLWHYSLIKLHYFFAQIQETFFLIFHFPFLASFFFLSKQISVRLGVIAGQYKCHR